MKPSPHPVLCRFECEPCETTVYIFPLRLRRCQGYSSSNYYDSVLLFVRLDFPLGYTHLYTL